jgi:hypothetical protein
MGRRAKWGVGLGIVLVLALVGVPLNLAGAQQETGGNPQCADFDLLQLTRFDPVPGSGSATQDGVTITITGSNESGEAVQFSWTSETPIDLVIVKGGATANLYSYDEATADTGLTAPEGKGISHISFCFDEAQPSPSPSPTESPSPSPSPSPTESPSPSPSPSPTESPSPSPSPTPSPTVGGRIVTPPPPGAQPPDQVAGTQALAVTGAELALMVLVAGALLLLGAALIYSARRRSPQKRA